VRALQRRLAGLGFTPGPVDGRYGPLTTRAVMGFQTAARLLADGITGAHTLSALRANSDDALAPGAGYRQATGSARVRGLQRRVAGLGFDPGPVDGRYGPLTTRAVMGFQRAHHLMVRGTIDRRTLVDLELGGHAGHAGRRVPAPVQPPTRGSRVRPAVGRDESRPVPSLPLTPVLLALVALGLATVGLTYGRTSARARRAQTPVPAPTGTQPAPSRFAGPASIEPEGRRR
jgi:peptidoglycan hydrolase-like protein with peptidoglycan-binding domain